MYTVYHKNEEKKTFWFRNIRRPINTNNNTMLLVFFYFSESESVSMSIAMCKADDEPNKLENRI